MNRIKDLSELALEDENRFQEDKRKQESRALKIARERMQLKGEINELKMKLSEPPNFNKYVNDLQDKIRLLESDNKAMKRIFDGLRAENKKLKKELVDIKSKKAKITKERRTFEIAYKSVKNKSNENTMNTLEDLETKLKNCTSSSSQRGRLIDEVVKFNSKSKQILNDNNLDLFNGELRYFNKFS